MGIIRKDRIYFRSVMFLGIFFFMFFSMYITVSASDGSNNSSDTAIELLHGQQISTSIDFQGDEDWYKINVSQTGSIASTITNNNGYIYYQLYDSSLNSLYGYFVGNETKTISWKVASGEYYIKIYDYSYVNYSISNVTLVANIVNEDQWENNDTSDQAVEIIPGQEISGISIEAVNDYEWFKINVNQTSSIVSTLTMNGASIYYEIYNSSLNYLYGFYPEISKIGSYKVVPGTYYIRIKKYNNVDYFNNNITLRVDLLEEDPWENNDTSNSAVEITPGQEINGISIEAVNDYDWFKINVNQKSSIASTFTINGASIDYEIYDSSLNHVYGFFLETNKTVGYKVSPGTYYIKISKYNNVNYFNNNITLRVDLLEEDQWENNDTSDSAYQLTSGEHLSGIAIEAVNDIDWFKIRVDHDGQLITTLTNSSGYLYYLLYDESFKQLVYSYVSPSGTDTKNLEVTSGVYYLKLYDGAKLINPLESNITLDVDIEYDYNLLSSLGNRIYNFFVSDPVNSATGNFTYNHTDLKISTRGLPLEFTRYYNSREGYSGPLGKGWQHNYNSFLTVNADNSVSVFYPDGHSTLFTFENGVYHRPAGSFEILSNNGDGTYTLTFKDQIKYIYDSEGRLISILDKNNNAITLQYSNSLLTTVSDPVGRSLQFTYEQNNLLTQITDPANRTVQFTYDSNGNLLTSKDANGGITTYIYGQYGITQINDARNNIAVKNTYDSDSRVILQEDGKGKITSFSYDTTNKKNIITDPLGNITTFYYDDKYRVTQIAYPEGITNFYSYDDDYNKISETDQNGNIFTYTYDQMGNRLTKSDPAPLNYLTSYTYDSKNNPTKVIDAAGYETNFTYDANGNLLTVSKDVYGGTAVTSYGYNEYGQIIAITDGNNKTSQFSYNDYGYKLSETDPLGHVTSYTYDIVGRKLTKTDARGNMPDVNPADFTWIYSYDANGNVLAITDPLGNITTNTYDANNNLISTKDPRNNSTTFTYDENNRLLTTTDSLANITSYQYDANGNRIAVTDGNGHTTIFVYDGLNRLTSVTDPLGYAENYVYDGNGNKTALTDKNGKTTSYVYDELNRITSVTDPNGGTLSIQYDPLGNKISETNSRENITRYTYDQNNKLLSVFDPLDHITNYTYDLAGNMLGKTNPLGAKWQYTYDNANRVIQTTDPLGYISIMEYDSVGNAVYGVDANGVNTSYQYDALNRLISVTDALANTTSYTYDENGNVTQITNAKGQIKTMTYDALNRLSSETDSLGHLTRFEYDAVGNVTAKTKPDGTIIKYSYDGNNRLKKITYPNQSETIYSYDPAGNRISMVDSTETTSYTYDNANQMTSVTKDVYSIDYSYDLEGNITDIIYPDGLTVSYTYNELNQEISVTDSVYSLSISYDAAGNRIQEILPNGIYVNYAYDLNGNLTVIEHVYGDEILAKSAYTLDPVGNRLSTTDEQNKITNYTYDDLYQLIRAAYPDGQTVEYTYDQVGNRLTANEVAYTYDAANRLIQADDLLYSYDPNGNLLSVGEDTYYEYNYDDQLVLFTNDATTIEYSYDGDGLRTTQSVTDAVYGTIQHNYIYDINTGIPQLLVEMDSIGNTNNYLYAGRLFSRIGNEGSIYYHQDGLGSISVISDVYGQPLNRYTYDAFGSPITVNESIDNIFRYTGEIYDDSGLMYLRARYYDPAIGRFISKDTYSGQLNDPLSQNLYVYVGNNPVLYIDPTGHFRISRGLDIAQAGLDICGLVPAAGEFCDGANALIYLARGDNVNASLSAAAMIPFAGWGATGAKYTLKYGDDVVDIVKGTGKNSSFGPNTVGAAEKYIPTNIKIVDDKYLKKQGFNAHELKTDLIGDKNMSKYDIYVDKDTGMLWIYKKGGKGEGIPTYEYIK